MLLLIVHNLLLDILIWIRIWFALTEKSILTPVQNLTIDSKRWYAFPLSYASHIAQEEPKTCVIDIFSEFALKIYATLQIDKHRNGSQINGIPYSDFSPTILRCIYYNLSGFLNKNMNWNFGHI